VRLKRLDILRCIAVLLVLQSHSELPSGLTLAGYVGVNLFFVLSGYLISGLLFAEYKQRQTINFGRFFIRRSLKIYPSYYVLVLVTILYHLLYHQVVPLYRYIGEIFYIQNYIGSLWGPEWSLAVEEHFYILLPLFLLVLTRWSTRRENPFQTVPWAFLFTAVACLAFRVASVSRLSDLQLQEWNMYGKVYVPTQNRLDGLFLGVLLGYLHHFRGDILRKLFDSTGKILTAALLAVLLLAPAYLVPQRNKLMVTVGLTAIDWGFAIVLMLSLRVRGILPALLAKPCAKLGDSLATIGMYSYPIYLWHDPVRTWVFALLPKFLDHAIGPQLHFFLYLSATIVVGVTFSRLVEYPILKLRDRFLPAMPEKTASVKPIEKTHDWQRDQTLTNAPTPD